MDVAYFAEWIRRAFALAFYSAGVGSALGVLFVMVIWCALRPGTTTVLGTGLVALGVLGAGAHGAIYAGHSFVGSIVLFWGAVFVALSLRGARGLEPAFFAMRREARALGRGPSLETPPSRSSASGGPYRRQDGLDDRARRALRAERARSEPTSADPAWSRAVTVLYASAVLAVFVGVRFAS